MSTESAAAQYADFSGEASRSEYWWFQLFGWLALLGAVLISKKLGIVVIFGLFLPKLSVTTRRLHDLGRSGWWQLIYFLPGIGWILLDLYLMLKGESNGEYEH